MPVGPGKYDDLCTYVREQAKGICNVVIVVDGVKGSGFSVQATTMEVQLSLPALLRKIAKEIERSLRGVAS